MATTILLRRLLRQRKMTQIKIEYRVVHYYARYAKTQRYEPPTVCCRTWGRCNSWTQKARDPSMSRGENCRRHNTIEDIIIVRGEERNTTTSRVRWHFQPALLTKRILARIAHIKEVVLIPENNPGVSVIIRCGPSCGYPGLLVLLVNRAHQSRSWREGFIDEDEDGLLRCELDALANHVDELADRQVLQYGVVWYGRQGKMGVGRGKRGFKSVSRIAYVSWDTGYAPRVLSISFCRWWGCPSCLPFHISPAKRDYVSLDGRCGR